MTTKNCDNSTSTAKMHLSHSTKSANSSTQVPVLKPTNESYYHGNQDAMSMSSLEVSRLLSNPIRYPEWMKKLMLSTLTPERWLTERLSDSADPLASLAGSFSQGSLFTDLLARSHMNSTHQSSQQTVSNGVSLAHAHFQGHLTGHRRYGKRDGTRDEAADFTVTKAKTLHPDPPTSSLTSSGGVGNRVEAPGCRTQTMARRDTGQDGSSSCQKPRSSGSVRATETVEYGSNQRDQETDLDESESGSKNSQSLQCVVCGDKSSGKHYGQHTCEGCKSFFKRSVRRKLTYTCRGSHECPIDIHHRNQCQYCRFQKCIKEGMRREAVQPGRLLPYQSVYNSPLLAQSGLLRARPVVPGGTDLFCATMSARGATVPGQLVDMFLRAEPAPTGPTPWLSLVKDTGLLPDQALAVQSGEGSVVDTVNWRASSQAGTGLRHVFIQTLIAGIQWAKNIPLFNELKLTDRQLLLSRSWLELFLLNLAYNHPHLAMSSIFQLTVRVPDSSKSEPAGSPSPSDPITGESKDAMTPMPDHFERVNGGPAVCTGRWPHGSSAPIEDELRVNYLKNVLDQLEHLMSVQVDATELACMKAIVLFNSDVSGLSDPLLVDCMQEKAQWALSEYCRCQYTYCQQPFRFGRLLLRLPRLRHQHTGFISDALFGSSELVNRLLSQTNLSNSRMVETGPVVGSSGDLRLTCGSRPPHSQDLASDTRSPEPADLSRHSLSLPAGEQLIDCHHHDGTAPMLYPALPWQHVLPNFCFQSHMHHLKNGIRQSNYSYILPPISPWITSSGKSMTSSSMGETFNGQLKQDCYLNQTIDLSNNHGLDSGLKYSGCSSFNLSTNGPCTDDSDKSSVSQNFNCDDAKRSSQFHTIPWSAKPEQLTASPIQSSNIQPTSCSEKDKQTCTKVKDSDEKETVQTGSLDPHIYYSVIKHHLGQIQKQTSSLLAGGQGLHFSSGFTEPYDRSGP